MSDLSTSIQVMRDLANVWCTGGSVHQRELGAHLNAVCDAVEHPPFVVPPTPVQWTFPCLFPGQPAHTDDVAAPPVQWTFADGAPVRTDEAAVSAPQADTETLDDETLEKLTRPDTEETAPDAPAEGDQP